MVHSRRPEPTLWVPLFDAMAKDGAAWIPSMDLTLRFRGGRLIGARGPILGTDDLMADIHRDVAAGCSYDEVLLKIERRLREIFGQLLAEGAEVFDADADDLPTMPLGIDVGRLFDQALERERTPDQIARMYADRLDCPVHAMPEEAGLDAIALRTLRLASDAPRLRDLALTSGRGAPRRTAAFWHAFDRLVHRGLLRVDPTEVRTPERLSQGVVPRPEADTPTDELEPIEPEGTAAETPQDEPDAWGSAPPMVELELPAHLQQSVAPESFDDPEDELFASEDGGEYGEYKDDDEYEDDDEYDDDEYDDDEYEDDIDDYEGDYEDIADAETELDPEDPHYAEYLKYVQDEDDDEDSDEDDADPFGLHAVHAKRMKTRRR